ncbi:hypothetical protein T492DRAFT_837604 [Pavlovales sp. CCMP2436]|nr:hypothetical protein T492DRAFT_837604 [Pavlovales sp. CCMP2436]
MYRLRGFALAALAALAGAACPTNPPPLLEALAPLPFLAPGSAGYVLGAPFDSAAGTWDVGFFAGAQPGAGGTVLYAVDDIESAVSLAFTLGTAPATSVRTIARTDVLRLEGDGAVPLRLMFAAYDGAGRPFPELIGLVVSLALELQDDGSAYCAGAWMGAGCAEHGCAPSPLAECDALSAEAVRAAALSSCLCSGAVDYASLAGYSAPSNSTVPCALHADSTASPLMGGSVLAQHKALGHAIDATSAVRYASGECSAPIPREWFLPGTPRTLLATVSLSGGYSHAVLVSLDGAPEPRIAPAVAVLASWTAGGAFRTDELVVTLAANTNGSALASWALTLDFNASVLAYTRATFSSGFTSTSLDASVAGTLALVAPGLAEGSAGEQGDSVLLATVTFAVLASAAEGLALAAITLVAASGGLLNLTGVPVLLDLPVLVDDGAGSFAAGTANGRSNGTASGSVYVRVPRAQLLAFGAAEVVNTAALDGVNVSSPVGALVFTDRAADEPYAAQAAELACTLELPDDEADAALVNSTAAAGVGAEGVGCGLKLSAALRNGSAAVGLRVTDASGASDTLSYGVWYPIELGVRLERLELRSPASPDGVAVGAPCGDTVHQQSRVATLARFGGVGLVPSALLDVTRLAPPSASNSTVAVVRLDARSGLASVSAEGLGSTQVVCGGFWLGGETPSVALGVLNETVETCGLEAYTLSPATWTLGPTTIVPFGGSGLDGTEGETGFALAVSGTFSSNVAARVVVGVRLEDGSLFLPPSSALQVTSISPFFSAELQANVTGSSELSAKRDAFSLLASAFAYASSGAWLAVSASICGSEHLAANATVQVEQTANKSPISLRIEAVPVCPGADGNISRIAACKTVDASLARNRSSNRQYESSGCLEGVWTVAAPDDRSARPPVDTPSGFALRVFVVFGQGGGTSEGVAEVEVQLNNSSEAIIVIITILLLRFYYDDF